MKKAILLLSLTAVFAQQAVQAQTEAKPLKKVLELVIPREGGANGACVAWHPVLKRYYAAMAGNAEFFIGGYSTAGKLLTPANQETLFDIRGLWYNPGTKALQMNGYDTFGWGEYKLNGAGKPLSVKTIKEGMNQPTEQSVGAYDPINKQVYFFNEDGNIEKYNALNGEYIELFDLTLGYTADEAEDEDEIDNTLFVEDYNTTTVVYTGIKKAELGLLNTVNREIELYDLATGNVTRKFSLPEDATVESALNFAYANGIFWLFDKEARIWKGYK